jgi:hypothetical protein
MPAHKPGESIEGLEIQGHSRDPLRFQSTKKINGIKCFIFKAEFNVFAEIVVELPEDTQQIYINALTTMGERLGSDTALIAIIAKTRTPRQRDLFQKIISHASHKHGASEWKSIQQTNVKVITPRQEIVNALQKRDDYSQISSII